MPSIVPEVPLSELDAVNKMLDAIGSEIATSVDSGAPDTLKAIRTLRAEKIEILTPGWNSNTDYALIMRPDTAGYITVGPDVLDIQPVGRSAGMKLTIRVDKTDGLRKLYNKGLVNASSPLSAFKFTGYVQCNVVRNLDFDDLEIPLKSYVAARASRVFQESSMGSDNLDKFIVRREAEAYAKLLDAEATEESTNLLRDNRDLALARYHYRDPSRLLY